MNETVVKKADRGAEPLIVAKDGKKAKKEKGVLGPATVVRPALYGASILFVIQQAMKIFLKA